MSLVDAAGCVNLQLHAHFRECAFAADVKPIPHECAPRHRVTYFVT